MADDNNQPSTDIPEYLMAGIDQERSSMVMKLLMRSSAHRVLDAPTEDFGFAEHLPFPFMALVGQVEMRMALLLSIINPNIGGVLLIGPRGTGKTTAARGLSNLLPLVEHSTCMFGCMPDENLDNVCEDCADKLNAGEAITRVEPVRLVELPLNARLEDVVGGINERIAIQHNQVRLDRGILSRADKNLLYVDEVNLLEDTIVDAILDAAAQGSYTVRRGPMRANYRSKFVLIGSMNPEEGRLRPQILDRFGLRVVVGGLRESEQRLEVYRRVRDFRRNPHAFIQQFETNTYYAREEVTTAREMLPDISLAPAAEELGLALVRKLSIDSHRAEFTMFEAARAYAAADLREEATLDDLQAVAPMSLRMRRSPFITSFIDDQKDEDQQIVELFDSLKGNAS